MAAGDLLSANDQIELQGLLMGLPSTFVLDVPGIGGLGQPPTKSADTSLEGRDGSVGAPDFDDVRVITVPLWINRDNEDDAMSDFSDLLAAWDTARDGVDRELHLQLAGFGHFFFTGRPRGVTPEFSMSEQGVIDVLCTFEALDPTFHFV